MLMTFALDIPEDWLNILEPAIKTTMIKTIPITNARSFFIAPHRPSDVFRSSF